MGGASGSYFINPRGSTPEFNRSSPASCCHSQWWHTSSFEVLQGTRQWRAPPCDTFYHAALCQLCHSRQFGSHHTCYYHVLSALLWRCELVMSSAWPSWCTQLAASLQVPPLELLSCRCSAVHMYAHNRFLFQLYAHIYTSYERLLERDVDVKLTLVSRTLSLFKVQLSLSVSCLLLIVDTISVFSLWLTQGCFWA